MLTKNEQGNWVDYNGPWYKILEPRQDSPVDSQEEFQHSVHTVVELMYHWVSASVHKELLLRGVLTVLPCLAGYK